MTDYRAAREAMVDGQVRPAEVTRYTIVDAMFWAPRERFVPKAKRPVAYADEHIEVGPDRWLLAPRTFAKLLDAADIRKSDLVLDVGACYGYSALVVARLAAAVVALEEDEAMAAAASGLMSELEADNVVVETGPLAAGRPQTGPYDVILLEGGVERLPAALKGQLKAGGRLVAIFQEGPIGYCRVVTRVGDAFSTRRAFDAGAPVLPGFDAAPAFVF